jgi:hypothetical protein
MAPKDNVQLPLRWEFVPQQEARDRSIRWSWRAYTQAGKMALYSEGSFETLTECMDDAKRHGYGA